MINYFMKKYAMSQTGANNLRKAVFSRTILNLTKMFPPMIAFMFIFQSLSDMDTAEEAIALTPQNYVLIILALSLIHISEPTRQAEISYAVFCLKKKTSSMTRWST